MAPNVDVKAVLHFKLKTYQTEQQKVQSWEVDFEQNNCQTRQHRAEIQYVLEILKCDWGVVVVGGGGGGLNHSNQK